MSVCAGAVCAVTFCVPSFSGVCDKKGNAHRTLHVCTHSTNRRAGKVEEGKVTDVIDGEGYKAKVFSACSMART